MFVTVLGAYLYFTQIDEQLFPDHQIFLTLWSTTPLHFVND